MDKSIGTYICTFDFTETAMSALVRVLCGKFKPQGILPGTLRKSRKVLKSRQHWLVETYNRDRDTRGLDDLLQALARASAPAHPFLLTTSAHTFELFNPHIEEAHFVVRNSSTQALYGFCATYFTQGTGILGALFVDPGKRNVSIGRSLQRRALRGLTQKHGLKKLQLGMSFPGVFLGIPADDGAGLKQWFANGGWDLQFPRRLANLTLPSVPSWSAPEGLLQSIQRAGITFDLIHGPENADGVLAHIAAHAGPEVCELYRFALQEGKTCGVVRAKGHAESLLGTVVISSPGSPLAGYIPPLHPLSPEEMIGGIVAPVLAAATPQANLVLQGLTLMGLRQNKAHKATRSVLSWVQDDAYEPLVAMGFEVVQVFEEFTNSPENVSADLMCC